MPQHLKCIATVIYDLPLIAILVSNCHLFSAITISQGSVATRLRCGGIFSYNFTANLSPSLTMNTAMSLVVQFFGTQCTYIDAAYCYRQSSVVCRSVGLSVCHSSEPCKKIEPIEMPFGLRTRVNIKNHVLDGGQDIPTGMGNLQERDAHCKV